MDTARLARMHSRFLLTAAERRAAAARLRDTDPERAEMALDDACEALANANALRDMLATLPGVHVPDERQISLFSDGETHSR
jgi:hypothetical protein